MVIELKKPIRLIVMGFLGVAIPLFLVAGTLNWANGWVFLAVFFSSATAFIMWMYMHRPDLLAERMNPSSQGQKVWDKVFRAMMALYGASLLVLMPLDAVRLHWSRVPIWLQGVGGVCIISSFAIFILTARENPYMASVARVQKDRGQTVISTGLYHYIRHPMYFGSLFLYIGMPLLLGSWYGLLLSLVGILMLAWRAVMEERLLCEGLQGYESYLAEVKYRFVPYVW
jgi:protein-S-isoprenylcysteine O-methyltransferase Ste14